jgi:hypothetical protein
MQNFLSNITFFILDAMDDWRDDLTKRYCEHFSRILNGDFWRDRVMYSESVDESIEKCSTRYCLIQTSSSIVCSLKFFEECSAHFDGSKNFMLCDFIMDDDYAIIDKSLMVIDRERWENAGKPLFASKLNTSPLLKVVEKTNDTRYPKLITLHDTEHVLVSRYCANNGAEMISANIKLAGNMGAIRNIVNKDHHYCLKRKNKFEEIYHETFFDKNYYQRLTKQISIYDNDEYNEIQKVSADYLVVPAKGLKAVNLAEYLGAQHIIVYDKNPLALELQKRILSIKTPTLFGQILKDFIKDYEKAEFAEAENMDEFTVVYPTKVKSKKFICLDAFSYELLDLAALVNNEKSAVFDMSDLFSSPHHYFLKRTENVEALFIEACSRLKSRRGPSFILGKTPNNENLNSIKLNTNRQVSDIEEISTDKYENWEDEIEIKKEEIKELSPLQKKIEEIIQTAKGLDYQIDTTRIGQDVNALTLTKVSILPDFNCVYEYKLAVSTLKWSFKINKYGYDKKLELSNGNTLEAFVEHLKTHNKFNAKSVVKML